MNEISQNKNVKGLKILLLMHSDVDDLIKETFLFLTHPTPTLHKNAEKPTVKREQGQVGQ